jgi:hypothetical protein
MTNKLQKRHGTAVIHFVNRHILASDVPAEFGLGTGSTVRLQIGSRLCIAFSLHLLHRPITNASIVEAGGGSSTKVHHTLAYLVSTKILAYEAKLTGNVGGRVNHYYFTDEFADRIDRIHAGIGTD